MTKLKKIDWDKTKNTNLDKTQNLKSWNSQFLKKSFGKNNLTPRQRMRCTWGSLLWSCDVFVAGAGELSNTDEEGGNLLWWLKYDFFSFFLYLGEMKKVCDENNLMTTKKNYEILSSDENSKSSIVTRLQNSDSDKITIMKF